MQTNLLNSKFLPSEEDARPGVVLVVDDEEHNRMLLRDSLEARGYQVIEAEDGMQALQKVAEHQPDVILLDVMMPRMDGFEVCRRLRTFWKTVPIQVLIVTALSERKERLMGIEAGATDFLNKPIDLQEMAIRISNAVQTKRLFDRLRTEQERSEQLLLSILPVPIAERMKKGETSIAENVPEATILLADLVGFTTLSMHVGPEQVVCLLNEIFSAFDLAAEKRGLEKVKTVGDAYLVAGGVPVPRPDHAEAIAELAIDMQKEIDQFNRQYKTSIRIRIGISSGPVIAGVIGRKRFAYDIWGDTVNQAFQIAASAEIGSIMASESAHDRLRSLYRFESRQSIGAKGRSDSVAYLLKGRIAPDTARNESAEELVARNGG